MLLVALMEGKLTLLHEQIQFAKKNLFDSIRGSPMHSTLLTLVHILRNIGSCSEETQQRIIERALDAIIAACDVVLPVLSNKAPEGITVSEFDEVVAEDIEHVLDTNEMTDSQKSLLLTSGCWRVVGESCQFISVLLDKFPFTRLTMDQVTETSRLLRNLSATVQHVGAFSSVQPAWAKLCHCLLDSGESKYTNLVTGFLRDDLSHAETVERSITRRSAGLPVSILSMVVAESISPHATNRGKKAGRGEQMLLSSRPLLSCTMTTLFEMATRNVSEKDVQENRTDLPQVHAFNVLRAVIRDSRMATDVAPWMGQGFMLAIRGFANPWYVRHSLHHFYNFRYYNYNLYMYITIIIRYCSAIS
jgi:hypothetical protein